MVFNIFVNVCIQWLLHTWSFILQFLNVVKSEFLPAKLCKLLMLLLFVVNCFFVIKIAIFYINLLRNASHLIMLAVASCNLQHLMKMKEYYHILQIGVNCYQYVHRWLLGRVSPVVTATGFAVGNCRPLTESTSRKWSRKKLARLITS